MPKCFNLIRTENGNHENILNLNEKNINMEISSDKKFAYDRHWHMLRLK
jgi:hypothetical protein